VKTKSNTKPLSHQGKKRFNIILFYLCLSVFICGSNALAKAPAVKETAPLKIQVPVFSAKTLSCGMKVLFLKNDEMPLVQANLYLQGGSAADPMDREGLADLVAGALRNGGAGSLSPEAFDKALENKAASMSASAEPENFTAEFKCLSEDLPDILELFADMLLKPKFNAKRLETDRANTVDALKRLQDTPETLTRVLFYKTLFHGSLYGRWASPRTVAKLTKKETVDFYEKTFSPAGAVLVLSGKFGEDQVFKRLENLFGGWKKAVKPAAENAAKPMGPAIYFFPKDVPQVFIRFGLMGIKRHDPDVIPLQVANHILGGSGFTSRLMKEIRSDRGLAYFVGSNFVPFDIRGPFVIVGGTRPDAVKEYLDVMFKMVSDFAKKGPTEGELSEAKRSIIEEFAYNFESSFKLAEYKGSLDFHGYPEDYLETYREKVGKVGRNQAARAAGNILSQKDWVLIVCGPESLEKMLSEYGKVVKVTDIFAPLPEKP
jgi:zinc protease